MKVEIIFNSKIILYLAKKILITKEFLFFTITNLKYAKNILFKIPNYYTITKLNNIINFYFNKYKIVTIIFQLII